MRRSRISSCLSRLLDESERDIGIFAAEKFVLLSLEVMVVDEELLEFGEEILGKIGGAGDLGVEVVGLSDGQQAVVAGGLFAVALFAFDDSDETGAEEAAGECGLVHEDENVDGIAVGGNGTGKKAEVVGELHAGRKDFFEGEDLLIGVEGVFVATALGGFDDDLKDVVLVDGLELNGIREGTVFCHGLLREMLTDD
jgi:hypothetical protein